MLAEIIILIVLIIINGIFSMSEIAIVSSRKSKLEADAEEGDKKAKSALEIAESPTKFLSTVQVGITLIGILTGVFGGGLIADRLAIWLMQYDFLKDYAEVISLLIVVLIITYFSLVIGELVPKRIGLTNPEKIASIVAKPMNLISKITSPAVWLLSTSTEGIIKLLGIKSKESIVTEEEIKAMMKEASDTGEVEKAEHDIVERVFFLGDTDAGSLMTSIVDVVFLDINDPFEVNKKIISESIHTNFPIYENDPDNVIGILNLKTIVPSLLEMKEPDLRSLLKKPLFVPENTNAFDLLESLKNSHTHFAVVVDEYGGVKGIVTTNDVFKALVGNLYTSSTQEAEITRREDGTHLVDALISLDELFRYFEIEDTEEIRQQGFFTLGGMILHLSKSLPKAGEKFIWRNYSFEVVDMDGRRVDKVLVTKLSEDE